MSTWISCKNIILNVINWICLTNMSFICWHNYLIIFILLTILFWLARRIVWLSPHKCQSWQSKDPAGLQYCWRFAVRGMGKQCSLGGHEFAEGARSANAGARPQSAVHRMKRIPATSLFVHYPKSSISTFWQWIGTKLFLGRRVWSKIDCRCGENGLHV